MNTENLGYLKDTLKYHGFGEKLYPELEQSIGNNLINFTLRFTEPVNGKTFEALLNFRRGENSDMYYFNNYVAKLDRGIKENIEQTFYINKGKGVTAKEAYNLLDGRSVYKELTSKEGASYQAWLQLDPKGMDKNGNFIVKQYHANYGFDLGKSLAALPVKELETDEERMKLVRSLERGNLQAVTFNGESKGERMFIEANPQYKTVTVYGSDMKRVKKNDEKIIASPSVDQKNIVTQKNTNPTLSNKTQAKPDLKKTKSETGLMPKKKTNTKKGLMP